MAASSSSSSAAAAAAAPAPSSFTPAPSLATPEVLQATAALVGRQGSRQPDPARHADALVATGRRAGYLAASRAAASGGHHVPRHMPGHKWDDGVRSMVGRWALERSGETGRLLWSQKQVLEKARDAVAMVVSNPDALTLGTVAGWMAKARKSGEPFVPGGSKTGAKRKLTDQLARQILYWHAYSPELTASDLADLASLFMRHNCGEVGFRVSQSSVNKMLKASNMVFKMSRVSRKVIFHESTAYQCFHHAMAFDELADTVGGHTRPSRVVFGDETLFNIWRVPTRVWAERGLPARVEGKPKGGLSVLVFLDGSAAVFSVHGNIGQSTGDGCVKQFSDFEEDFNEKHGDGAGLLLVVDHSKPHHSAFAKLYGHIRYWPATKEDEDPAPYVPLSEMATTRRIQYMVMREGDPALGLSPRYLLFTPPGMAAFQPCEILFNSLREQLAHLPREARTESATAMAQAPAIEYTIKRVPERVTSGCLRSAKHFRDAWKLKGGTNLAARLSLHEVERMVREQRAERHRRVGLRDSYADEVELLRDMLARAPPGVEVHWSSSEGGEERVVRELDETADFGSLVWVPDVSVSEVKQSERGRAEWDQQPVFHWEAMPQPRQSTRGRLAQQIAELGGRDRVVLARQQLAEEDEIRRQALRVAKAAKRERAKRARAAPDRAEAQRPRARRRRTQNERFAEKLASLAGPDAENVENAQVAAEDGDG